MAGDGEGEKHHNRTRNDREVLQEKTRPVQKFPHAMDAEIAHRRVGRGVFCFGMTPAQGERAPLFSIGRRNLHEVLGRPRRRGEPPELPRVSAHVRRKVLWPEDHGRVREKNQNEGDAQPARCLRRHSEKRSLSSPNQSSQRESEPEVPEGGARRAGREGVGEGDREEGDERSYFAKQGSRPRPAKGAVNEEREKQREEPLRPRGPQARLLERAELHPVEGGDGAGRKIHFVRRLFELELHDELVRVEKSRGDPKTSDVPRVGVFFERESFELDAVREDAHHSRLCESGASGA